VVASFGLARHAATGNELGLGSGHAVLPRKQRHTATHVLIRSLDTPHGWVVETN